MFSPLPFKLSYSFYIPDMRASGSGTNQPVLNSTNQHFFGGANGQI
jgi:hypothetical protein